MQWIDNQITAYWSMSATKVHLLMGGNERCADFWGAKYHECKRNGDRAGMEEALDYFYAHKELAEAASEIYAAKTYKLNCA